MHLYVAGSGGGQAPNEALRNELERGLGDIADRAVKYPAVGVLNVDGLLAAERVGGKYHNSVVAGKRELRRLINANIDECRGSTKLIISGYSQGAQVAADVFQEFENDKRGRGAYIYALILFGDPYFNSGDDGAGASWGARRHVKGRDGSLGRRGGFTSKYRGRVRSYCHRKDPICQGDRPTVQISATLSAWKVDMGRQLASGRLSFAEHNNYHEVDEAQDAGRWLSTKLRAELGITQPGTQPPPTEPVDQPSDTPDTTPVLPVTPPVPTWREQQGSRGANTFSNPYNASGQGPRVEAMSWVDVSCKVYAPQIASANPDGYWYRIASAPWNNAYYAVANTFWNGDVPGQKPYTHNTDFNVPDCS